MTTMGTLSMKKVRDLKEGARATASVKELKNGMVIHLPLVVMEITV